MRGPPDSHPDLHRRLCIYHLRKWISPAAKIPMPQTEQQIASIAPNPEPGGFLDPLDLRWVGGKRPYKIRSRYRYTSLLVDGVIEVEPGYLTDFASIPWLFRRILPKNGPYTPAAVVHDWLCDQRGKTGIDSKTTHEIFREAMELLEVPGRTCAVMYQAVRWFGPRFSVARQPGY